MHANDRKAITGAVLNNCIGVQTVLVGGKTVSKLGIAKILAALKEQTAAIRISAF